MKRKIDQRIFTARPDVAVVFCSIFVTGLLLAGLLPPGSHLALAAVSLVCLGISFAPWPSCYRLAILAMAALTSAAFYGNLRNAPATDYQQLLKLDQTRGTVSGQFKGEVKMSGNGSIRFMLVDGRYQVDEQTVLLPGPIECYLKNPDFIPEPEQSYAVSGSFSVGQAGAPPRLRGQNLENITGRLSPAGLTGRIQRQLRDGLKAVLPRRHAGIVIGFILGDTSQITLDDRKLFKETGISHLLAVSGQHIMVIIMFLAALLHWLKVPPLSRSIFIGIFLTVYAMTTMGSPSVWRALVMYLCVAVVIHIEAFPSPVRPVALAAFLLLLYKPELIFNAAFQLSFTAVLSIVFLRPPLEMLLRKLLLPQILARYLGVTLAANIGIIPMTAFLFGTVSASALLVNPMLIWSFSYILPVAFLTAFLSVLWPAASVFVAPGLSLVLDGMLIFLDKAQAIPGQFFYVGNIPGYVIAFVYGLMLYFVATVNRRQLQTARLQEQAPVDRLQRRPEEESSQTEGATNPAKTYKEPKSNDTRATNPFKHAPTLAAMDSLLCSCKRRPLKNSQNSAEPLIPLHLLSIDSQNLYHLMLELDRQSFASEPERLLQSHIFLMSLAGSEILNRISTHLDPPPSPGEIRVCHPVKDRHLATAVLAELILHSSILTRSRSESFMMLIAKGQSVFNRARRQLERILEQVNFEESVEQHFSLRRDLLAWCTEFIEFDNNYRSLENTRLRPEQ